MPIDIENHLLKRRRTKIVATVGPASSDPGVLRQLVDAGVNVFRLNMSHGAHDGHRVAFENIRRVAGETKQPVAILADLCGPKIRCGSFDGGRVELATGSTVTVTTRDIIGSATLIPSQYGALADDVVPGSRILLDDGNLELRVGRVEGTEITCQVVQGGTLKDRKGMNLPGVVVSAPSLTAKDREDAIFALGLGVEYLALSFVRHASDVDQLRALIRSTDASAFIIAKIEKPEAIDEIDAILDAADGVMVARGDLGVELPAEVVPIVQGQLIDLARKKQKPVIVATQMLESMIGNPRPTRAEVSDVANAVFDGADAVMLSAETAAGAFPVKAVETMDRVARQAEAYMWKEGAFGSIVGHELVPPPVPMPDAIARATAHLSRDLRVRSILITTRTGLTARIVSAARPAAPTVAVSYDAHVARTMNLLWGVIPVHVTEDEFNDPARLGRQLLRELDLAGRGDVVIRVSGFSADQDRNVPTISVHTV